MVVLGGRGSGDRAPVVEGGSRRIGQEGMDSSRGRRQGEQSAVPGLRGREM